MVWVRRSSIDRPGQMRPGLATRYRGHFGKMFLGRLYWPKIIMIFFCWRGYKGSKECECPNEEKHVDHVYPSSRIRTTEFLWIMVANYELQKNASEGIKQFIICLWYLGALAKVFIIDNVLCSGISFWQQQHRDYGEGGRGIKTEMPLCPYQPFSQCTSSLPYYITKEADI